MARDRKPGRERRRPTAEQVKQLVAERIKEKLEQDPERYAKALELGIFDPDWLADPSGRPFSELLNIQRVQTAIAARVHEEPSVLGKLDLSALDVLSGGATLTRGDAAVPAPATGETGTRGRLTVVFTDLEGFTEFTASEGDVAASGLLRAHYDVLGSLVRSRGGRVVKTIGDGHMLAFPEPSAAVLASVEMTGHCPGPLRVRSGAHHGDLLVGPGDLFGHVVNLAARVTGAAAGGEALVTDEVRLGAGDVFGVSFGAPREEHLKGIEEPVTVFEVASA